MQYFNIRYECNDARDDYSAQLKNGNAVDGAFPKWMSSEVLNDLDDTDPYCEGANFGDGDDNDNEDHIAHKYSGIGRKGQTNQNEMDAARMGAKEAGWLDDSPNRIAEVDNNPV